MKTRSEMLEILSIYDINGNSKGSEAIIGLHIANYILIPAMTIWAMNTLFPLEIQHGIFTYIAVAILRSGFGNTLDKYHNGIYRDLLESKK